MNSELLRRIDELLRARHVSARAASLRAGLGPDYLRDLRRRTRQPAAEKLLALERSLDAPRHYFVDAIGNDTEKSTAISDSSELSKELHLATIYVKGAVQAGVWREAFEWSADDWFSVTVPADNRFPETQKFGLLVRGTSMDRLYPPGTIIIAVRFDDIADVPQSGQRVVVLRRSASGEFEATLKEYEVDSHGRHVLWPRSTDPEFQSPFILAEPPGTRSDSPGLPPTVSAGTLPQAAGAADVTIVALVIGSYRPE